MSIGIIRNLGTGKGGGTKVPYLYKDGNVQTAEFLYKDGTQVKAWDNRGYKMYGIATSDGGGIFHDTNVEIPAITSKNHNRTIITNEMIDMTPYKTVNLEFTNGTTMSLNVSSYAVPYYVVVANCWLDNGTQETILGISTVKEYFFSNSNIPYTNISGVSQRFINRIWFEKKIANPTDDNAVIWDNTGTYISESGYYSAGGATLNDGNMSFSTPSTSMYNRAIITDSVIDVSQYSTLKVACVYNSAEHVLSVDISSIVSSSGYIVLSQSNYSGQKFLAIVVATQKNNFSVNHLAQLVTNTNANLVVVNRVWLEK